MGVAARLRVLSLSAAFGLALLAPQPAQAAQLPLLAACQARSDATDSFSYRFCSAATSSFDGTSLDTDLTLPGGATPAGGYPLLVMMHGWGASKSYWESSDFCATSIADACNYNNVWFANRGYAVLTYTARGFHASQGYTHLADMRWEVHDTQYLAGLLVDAGVAKPGVGVTGLSYGAGQSWLLAVLADRVMNPDGTLTTWLSPAGTSMRVAAAVPKYGWTDLVDALQPNGRSSDGVLAPNGERRVPIGIEKKSYVDYFYQSGLQTGRYAAPGQDPTADQTAWYAEISAGETPTQSTYGPGITYQIAQFRSAYYQDAMLASDVANGRETPVFDVQGWTDVLFPESQAASMMEKLRAADPRWPVFMYASDLGHPTANNNKFSEWRVINQQATAFLDLHVASAGGADPGAMYQEQLVTCDASAGPVYASNTVSGTAPARLTFESSGAGHTTASAPTDAAAGVATDPIAVAVQHGGNGACVQVAVNPPDSGASTSWTFPVCAAFTLLGEPGLHLNAAVTGTDAEINARLWDVAPDGSATLVTRAAYRWTGSAGATSIGYALQGSGWTFLAGHQLRLQVTQNDAPYLRLDNYPSSVSYASMKLTLPTTASIGC
jgi:ABC-2 type transport system ATP-binding protein